MTIEDLIAQIEGELAANQEQQRNLRNHVQAVIDTARQEGRANLSQSEDAVTAGLFRDIEDSKATQKRIEARLERARTARAEDEKYLAASRHVRDSGAPRASQTASFSAGTNRPDLTDAGPLWRYADTGQPAAVARGQRFADHELVRQHSARNSEWERAVTGTHGNFGNFITRALTTSGASAVVPTIWAADVIDKARNFAAVVQAGAQVVPMAAKVVQIGRLDSDPTAAYYAEGGTITASDPGFSNVTLTAKTLSALVVGSLEWFQDAQNAGDLVTNALAKAMATQLDYVALMGGVTSGGEGVNLASPPNPKGILASLLSDAASSVLGGGANGTNITAATPWNEILDTIYTPRLYNEEPNALLWAPKMQQKLAKTYLTTYESLPMPADVANLRRFVTNQVPSGFTQGTLTTGTDVFAGDFTKLLIGTRMDISVQRLDQRYAETGQIALVAHWRGDIALARPRAFAVYRYLQGA